MHTSCAAGCTICLGLYPRWPAGCSRHALRTRRLLWPHCVRRVTGGCTTATAAAATGGAAFANHLLPAFDPVRLATTTGALAGLVAHAQVLKLAAERRAVRPGCWCRHGEDF